MLASLNCTLNPIETRLNHHDLSFFRFEFVILLICIWILFCPWNGLILLQLLKGNPNSKAIAIRIDVFNQLNQLLELIISLCFCDLYLPTQLIDLALFLFIRLIITFYAFFQLFLHFSYYCFILFRFEIIV